MPSTDDSGTDWHPSLLSAYEIARLNRIKENKAFLASLGIVDGPVGGAKKKKKRGTTSDGKPARKRKRREPKVPAEPSRRSRRVAKQAPEMTGSELPSCAGEVWIDDRVDPADADAVRKRKAEAERYRKEKYEALIEKHIKDHVKLPPTATYAHTVHRVLTMSEKKLGTRIRVIERAQGMYAVLKMRMFAEVLILEGYDELAVDADAALKRLCELPKFKALGGKGVAMSEVYKKAKSVEASAEYKKKKRSKR